MANWIKAEQVRSRVPNGRSLPARFEDFIRAVPRMRVQWEEMDHCNLEDSAANELLPFLRTGSGGVIPFWYHDATPAIVHLGSEGEQEVVANDFDDFLLGISARCSGVHDFDGDEEAFHVPGISGVPTNAGLSELQPRFEEWLRQNTCILQPLVTPETEILRQQAHRIALTMLGDGCCHVYTAESVWWTVYLLIERNSNSVSISYRKFGEWTPLPEKYGLLAPVLELLKFVRHPNLDRFEISTWSFGGVSINRARELSLHPPEPLE